MKVLYTKESFILNRKLYFFKRKYDNYTDKKVLNTENENLMLTGKSYI